MVKSATLRLAVLTAALACALALALIACGPPRGGSPAVGGADSTTTGSGGFPTTDSVLAELNALPCPDGVDAGLWAELKGALSEALRSQPESRLSSRDSELKESRLENLDSFSDVARSASSPPTGEANRVNDLAISDNGDGTYTLAWHYRNLGDYDQNGTVGISDITPLAQHFGEEVPEDDLNRTSILAVIDASGNGVVDISDITAIAANFQTEFGGYVVERSPSATEKYAGIATLALTDAAGDGRKRFAHTIPLARRAHYRVVPRSPDGQPGVPSEPFDFRLESGTWRMHGKDPRHTLRSPYVGPQSPEVNTIIAEPSCVRWNLVLGPDGTAFSIGNRLCAFGQDGSVLWSFTDPEFHPAEYASPAVAADGSVYCPTSNWLYALNPDGSLKWKSPARPGYACRPTIAPDGTIYLGTGDGFGDTEDGYLQAYSPEGSPKWEYLAGSDIVSTAAVDKDGVIYSATYPGRIFALDADGALLWDLQAEGTIWSSPAIGDDGTVYIGVQIGKWAQPPGAETGFLYAITPGGSLKWELATDSWVSATPAIGRDGTIYACDAGGRLLAVSPSGDLLWQFDSGGILVNDPAIGGDGTVYVTLYGDTIHAVNSDGIPKWAYAAPTDETWGVWGSPVISDDGSLYAIMRNHGLYILRDGL